MMESTQVSNFQTELKYLDLFKCYNILTDLGGSASLGIGGVDGYVGGCGCMGVPHASTHVHACMNACTHAHAC